MRKGQASTDAHRDAWVRSVGPSTEDRSREWSEVADGLATGGAQFVLADVEAGVGLLDAIGAVLLADALEGDHGQMTRRFQLDPRVRLDLVGGIGVVAGLLRERLNHLHDRAGRRVKAARDPEPTDSGRTS